MNLDKILVPERVETEEILDRDEIPIPEVEKIFDDLLRINRFFGGFGVYKKTLYKLLKGYPRDRRLSLLDIGTGSAELAFTILNNFKLQYDNFDDNFALTGLDVKHRFLQLAKQRNPDNSQLNYIVSDAFRMPFKDNSFDIVISNLLLHHYYNRALELVSEMYRVARYAVVINDLLRHRIPLLFFKLFSPMLVRSPITQNDGIVSLRRAISFSEIRQILGSSNFTDYNFVRHWSFRFGLVIRKKQW